MTTPMNTAANHETYNEGFIFYHSFDQMIDSMPDEKLQLETYKMICKYALYGLEPQTDNWLLRALFSAVKPQIDANNKRRANGKKGGRKPAQETAVPEPEAAEVASQAASTTPANVTTVAKAAATELDMTDMVNQLASQVLAAVQAATQTAPAAQAQPAMQAEPIMQIEAARQVQPATQAEPVMQTEAARQVQSTVQVAPVIQAQTVAGEPVKPTPRAQTAQQDNSLGPAERIVYFGENKYPTTPEELGRFEAFAYKLFEKYHGGKPALADMERVLERSYTRIERPDGKSIVIFDRSKADLLAYAFEQAKKADKLNWRYLDGMYRNFAARDIVTGAEALQYDLERAQRFV